MSGRIERRRLQRVSVTAPATIRDLEDGAALAGFSSDVSAEGILLWIPVELAAGHAVEVTLHLPPQPPAAHLILRSIGKVVRVERWRDDGAVAVAIAFDGDSVELMPVAAQRQ